MLVLSIIIYTVFCSLTLFLKFNVDVANIEFNYFYNSTVILSTTLTIYVHRSMVDLGYSSLYSKIIPLLTQARRKLALTNKWLPNFVRPSLIERQRENNDLKFSFYNSYPLLKTPSGLLPFPSTTCIRTHEVIVAKLGRRGLRTKFGGG